jgi:aryl-alcohol dehydrogenase-like predicted oxidoreductase
VERLDLVQFAWWDYAVPGYVETASWLDDVRRAGKIRHLGVTNFDTPRLAEIVSAGVRISTQQVQYSVLDRRAENGMGRFCQDQGIRLLCYGTLAGGFLSNRYLGVAAPEPPFANRSLTKYRLMIDEAGGWERFQALLGALAVIAGRHQASIAQVSLRWVLDRPEVACLLLGITDLDRMRNAAGALRLALSPEDVGLLDAWAREGPLPEGDVFEFERRSGGPHAEIMRYDLNEA